MKSFCLHSVHLETNGKKNGCQKLSGHFCCKQRYCTILVTLPGLVMCDTAGKIMVLPELRVTHDW
jgi:hypothetical protein